MICWQLAREVWRRKSREGLHTPIRTCSNRKFPELEILQLIENIERHPVL